jgi:PAS domain S-box-containing protein
MNDTFQHTELNETEKKLIRVNRFYLFLSQINQMIVKVANEEKLFQEVCRIAVENGKFRMAWVGLIDEQSKRLIPVFHAGEVNDYLSNVIISSIEGQPESKGPTGSAFREEKTIVCNDIENSPMMALWRDAALSRNYLSSISLPLTKFKKVIGTLTIYADVKNFFDKQEVQLLEECASDVSYVLGNLEKEKSRVQAEKELTESRKQYQTLAEISPVGIFKTDSNGYTTYVNPRWCIISGMKKEEALGNGWFNAVHPHDRHLLQSGWDKAILNQRISSSEYRFIKPDGTVSWVIGQAIPETDERNQIVGYVGTVTDITDRKKTEEEVAALYKEKETVLNRINDAMISVDNNWRYTFINEMALLTHPSEKEFILGKVLWDVHPEMIQTVFQEKYYLAMETKEVVEFENYYPPMSKWFYVKVYPSSDGLTILYKDVSKRKVAELALKESEDRYRKAQTIGKMGHWTLNLKTNVLTWSDEIYNLFGLSKSVFTPDYQTFYNQIHPDDREEFNKSQENAMAGISPLDIIHRIITPVNEIRYMHEIGRLIYDNNKQPIAFTGTVQDVTDRITFENEIINEKNLSDTIINALPGVFYLYTQEGRFLRWNRNFEEVTGYNSSEIKKMHPLDFIASGDKNIIAKKIENTFIQGEENVQAEFLLKSGKTIPYYFTGRIVEYAGVLCLAGVGIDFTANINAQLKIKETAEQLRLLAAHLQRIREEERKRIGREIHDELGQQLTAIKMDIAWIDKKIPDDMAQLKSKLNNVIGLLDSSNLSIRRILSELRSGIFDEKGLVGAMEWLSVQFSANTQIPVIADYAIPDTRLDESLSVCIFRLYQEALTNITRYAKATNVITELKIVNENLIFTVGDDGIGFDPALIKMNKSFGLLGMKERVLSLGGEFEFKTSPGNGTYIKAQLPFRNSIITPPDL